MGAQAVVHMHGYGGDPVIEGNVVETFKSGNTTIRICDDYVARTEDDIHRILEQFHKAGWAIVRKLYAEGKPV